MTRNLKIVISMSYYIFSRAAEFTHRLFASRKAAALVILTYHSVYEDEAVNFRKQMDTLKNTGRAVFPDYRQFSSDARHYVAVTFDDGYLNVLENALPVLQERDIPAAIFITTGSLGKKPEWTLDKGNRDNNSRIMTSEELTGLEESLVMIGSHTVTHCHLTQLDESSVRYELIDSKGRLEHLLGREVSLLAFPFGAYDQKVLSIAREAGYENVYANVPDKKPRRIRPEENPPFLLGRVSVTPSDGPLEFYLKCAGAYQWLPAAIELKRKLKFF